MRQIKKYIPFIIIAIILIVVMTYKKLIIPKESQFLEPLDPDDCVPSSNDDIILPEGSKGIDVKRLQIRMSYCVDELKRIKADPTLQPIPYIDNALSAYDEFLLHKGVDGILGEYTDILRNRLFDCTPESIQDISLNDYRKFYTYLKNYDVKKTKSIMNNTSDNSNFN